MQRLKSYSSAIRLIILFCTGFYTVSQAQKPELNLTEWATRLSDPSPTNNIYIGQLDSTLYKTGKAPLFLDELEKKGKGHHFHARFYIIKASIVYQVGIQIELKKIEPELNPELKPEIMKLLGMAIQEAYRSDDDYLVASVSLHYAHICHTLKEFELSMMYMMNAAELNEKLQIENRPSDYQVLGELLYQIKEYKESVKYSLKALHAWETNAKKDTTRIMWTYNTLALGYHRQFIYDSAFIFYKKALEVANELKLDLWKGIISGNMGQIYYAQKQYDTALALLQLDYSTSRKQALYNNAANSLQWAARTQLALGHKAIALQQVREALELLMKVPDVYYLRNTYYTATEVFKAIGAYDSAFYYSTRWATLNDSLDRVAALSSIAIARARANDEKSRYSIQSLQHEKENQLLLRNILMAAILVVTLFGILLFNRQRLKTKLKTERLEQEKLIMEREITSAKEQLKMFTNNIVEKTVLIEKLEEQIKTKGVSAEQQALMTELSQQTILTEDDWTRFKNLFEKTYPGFFITLKQKTPDITIAEQRMAALTRLQLTSKQIAAMLGISADSVRKTRQRLRMRLQLDTEMNLDEYINNI
jgi:tetratricopeptide (TPR) repeat protein/DNA-binding CsgD family transcriptional regulator